MGTVAPCIGPDGNGTVALGTGQMVASAIGMMIQQEALDLHKLELKVLCAPKCNDFEFPIIKTTKLLVEARSVT